MLWLWTDTLSPNVLGLDGLRAWVGSAINYSGDPVEHLRLLADKPVEELEAIRDDRRESVSRRAAAIMVLRMVDVDPDLQQKAFSEVADRTSGKAVQAVQMTQGHSADPSQVLATLRRAIRDVSLSGVQCTLSLIAERLPTTNCPVMPQRCCCTLCGGHNSQFQ